uniref:Uncharacterized protein TCIL3000_11_16380 n=1 Tax=Trypanosoma congolense (strain IL3000) TaxID=1068625 RepID=G0V3A3_TRYCI|nr:unnamed protein product [Trypanosoma congolense IL3000]
MYLSTCSNCKEDSGAGVFSSRNEVSTRRGLGHCICNPNIFLFFFHCCSPVAITTPQYFFFPTFFFVRKEPPLWPYRAIFTAPLLTRLFCCYLHLSEKLEAGRKNIKELEISRRLVKASQQGEEIEGTSPGGRADRFFGRYGLKEHFLRDTFFLSFFFLSFFSVLPRCATLCA